MNSIDGVLVAGDGVAHRSALLGAGLTPFELGRLAHSGRLVRVRRAWYALPAAPSDVIRAVRVGGALTAVSVAVKEGLWTIDDGKLHVAVPQNAARLRHPDTTQLGFGHDTVTNVCLHWRRKPGERFNTIEPMAAALVHGLECQPEDLAIASMDSALNLGVATKAAMARALGDYPEYSRSSMAAANREPRRSHDSGFADGESEFVPRWIAAQERSIC